MKKIVSIGLATAAIVGFTGCMGGGGNTLTMPKIGDKQRTQEIDPKIIAKEKAHGKEEFLMVIADKRLKTPMECIIGFRTAKNLINEDLKKDNKVLSEKGELKVANLISKNMTKFGKKVGIQCVKPNRDVEILKENEFVKKYPEAGKIINDSFNDAKKVFADRLDFIKKNAPEVLDLSNYTIANIKANDYKGITARYFPLNRIVIMGLDKEKLKNDAVYKAEFAFLISHELTHAFAMHTAEQLTQKAKFGVAVEVAINEAYKQLKDKQKEILNKAADLVANALLIQADYDYDTKVQNERKDSMAAKMAIKAGQKDKLEKMGIDLEVPQKTKLVIMELIAMNGGDPVKAIKGILEKLANPNIQNAIIESGAHAKNQEFEADAVAMQILKDLGIDTQKAVTLLKEAEKKEKGKALSAHPSAKDRIENLKKDGLI